MEAEAEANAETKADDEDDEKNGSAEDEDEAPPPAVGTRAKLRGVTSSRCVRPDTVLYVNVVSPMMRR